MGWAIIPYDKTALLSEINIGILYIFAISSLGVYGIIMSGWSSNSKYAFIGALRSAAQMVSYEVSIGFIIATIVVCCVSFNLQIIIESQKNIKKENDNYVKNLALDKINEIEKNIKREMIIKKINEQKKVKK